MNIDELLTEMEDHLEDMEKGLRGLHHTYKASTAKDYLSMYGNLLEYKRSKLTRTSQHLSTDDVDLEY